MVAIIDYGLGNLNSVAKAFANIGADVKITSRPQVVAAASHLVLPGQGAFADGINNIKKLKLDAIIYREVLERNKPILGICLGLQLMADVGFENGQSQGLGLISGKVVKVKPSAAIRLPHIGWDNIKLAKKSSLFESIRDNYDFYFLHSYYLVPTDKQAVIASCHYGLTFPVAFQVKNIFATLFHPEKSQDVGQQVIKNFLKSPH